MHTTHTPGSTDLRAARPRPAARAARRAGTACALLALVAVCAPAGAQAARAWQPAVDVPSSGQGFTLDSSPRSPEDTAFVDAEGGARALGFGPKADGSPGKAGLVATRPARGTWAVSPAPPAITRSSQAPDNGTIKVDPQGNAIAVWTVEGDQAAPDYGVVRGQTRPAGGDWSAPQDLSVPIPGRYISVNVFEVDAQGNALVLWGTSGGADGPVLGVTTRPVGGDWSAPQTLWTKQFFGSPGGSAKLVQGRAVVYWRTSDGQSTSDDSSLYVAAGDVGEVFSAAKDVSGSVTLLQPGQVALDSQGNAVAMWGGRVGATTDVPTQGLKGGENQVFAATSTAGQWSPPQKVSAPSPMGEETGGLGRFLLKFDAEGNAVAVWSRSNGLYESGQIQTVARPKGGPWSAQQNLTPSGENAGRRLELAVSPQGEAVVVWDRFITDVVATGAKSGKYFLFAAMRPKGGTWGAAHDLEPGGSPRLQLMPRLAFGTGGTVLVAWALSADVFPRVGERTRAAVFEEPVAPVAPVVPGGDPTPTSGGTAGSETPAPAQSDAPVSDATTTPASAPVASTTSSAPTAVAPASGGAQVAVESKAVALSSSEARRATALRRCLAVAGRRSVARARCVRLHGRTPGRVKGLRVRRVSATKLTLSFLATSSDASRGPAARSYRVKQSLRPIRGARGFARAQSLCRGSCRFTVSRVGQRVTLTVTDLRPGKSYYYAVAARDNVSGRLGARSAVVKSRAR